MPEITGQFKLIVAGGRDFNDYSKLSHELYKLCIHNELRDAQVELVSGTAHGADALAIQFARENNAKCYEFPAEWNIHGKSAGFIRNTEMAYFSDGLIAFWDGESRGTKHMIETMRKQGKPVWIIYY